MTDGFWQARRADKRCGLVWWQANAPPTEAGAVAAMPDDLRAAAVRALVVVGDLDGASRDERFGHALGQQTRRLRLKIDQLIDRGVGGDLALQRLEFDMVHGGVPSSPEIGEPVVTDAVSAQTSGIPWLSKGFATQPTPKPTQKERPHEPLEALKIQALRSLATKKTAPNPERSVANTYRRRRGLEAVQRAL